MIRLTNDDYIEQEFDIINDCFEILIEVSDCRLMVPIVIRDMFWSDNDEL